MLHGGAVCEHRAVLCNSREEAQGLATGRCGLLTSSLSAVKQAPEDVSTPPRVAASSELILLLTSWPLARRLPVELARGVPAGSGGISNRHTVSYSGAVTSGDAFSGATNKMQSACMFRQ